MPILTRCPACDRTLRVPDHLLGRPVRCPTCKETFTADEADEDSGGAAAEEAPAPRRPARPPADAVTATPSRPRRRLPPPPEDEEDEDEDDRPRFRRRGRGRRRRYEAQAAVTGPAVGLMVLGGLTVAAAILSLVLHALGIGILAAGAGQHAAGRPGEPDQAEAIANLIGGVVGAVVGLVWGGLIFAGALQMKALRNYGFAMAACIIAMVPCNLCCILGLPFGIWGLNVLSRPEVKEAFW